MPPSNLDALRRLDRDAEATAPPHRRTTVGRGRPFGAAITKRLTSTPFAVPVVLVAGFAAVFFAKFGSRFVPARAVDTAPVIALRDSSATPGVGSPAASGPAENRPRDGEPALFQATGWIEPDPLPTKASALINGVVDEVHVLEGQTVKRDDLLATLIDDDALLDLRTAERNRDTLIAKRTAHHAKIPTFEADIVALDKRITAAEALLEDAEDSAQRYRSLTPGSAPDRDVRKAELKARAERAVLAALRAERPSLVAELAHHRLVDQTMAEEVAAAEIEVARAQLSLDRTRITAPIDGIVLRLLAVPGQKRMLNMDDPDSATIAILYTPDALQVRVDVPLSEAAGLAVGQPASIRCDLLPDETFYGTVTRLAGEADLQRNTLQAKVNIVSPDPRMRPHMLCRVKFFAARSGGSAGDTAPAGRLVLFVPEHAVRQGPGEGETFVWVAEPDGRADRRPVTLGGKTRDDHVSVSDGLRPGERVITDPPGDLNVGQKVRPNPSS